MFVPGEDFPNAAAMEAFVRALPRPANAAETDAAQGEAARSRAPVGRLRSRALSRKTPLFLCVHGRRVPGSDVAGGSALGR